MSTPSGRWVPLGALAGAVVLASGCSGGDPAEAAAPRVPADFSATFEVESPGRLVAGNGRAWLLTADDSDVTLSTVDHTGRVDEVRRLPGQSVDMAPYRDGVVVTRRACAAEECEETAVTVLALDAAGETVAEGEFDRAFGGLDSSGEGAGIELLGVQDDVVWLDTAEELVGYDVATGETVARVPSPQGRTCLLADGLHTSVPLDGQYFGHPGPIGGGQTDPQYDVEFHRLVDGEWTPVPGSVQPLTDVQFQLTRCFAGGFRSGSGIDAAPAWSPTSDWVEHEPYLRPLSLTQVSEAVAGGQGNQLFLLDRDGVVRRWFAGPDGPMSTEMIDVPAEVFRQPFGPQAHMLFDRSPSVAAGCVQQPDEYPAAECWIGSVGA